MSGDFTNVPASRAGLLEMMYRSAQREPLGRVRFLPFILKQEISKFLKRLTEGRFRSQAENFGEFFLLRLSRLRVELESNGEAVSGDFALFQISGAVWCFCSIEKSSVLGKTVLPAIQQHASGASLIYISTREFHKLFEKLSHDGNRVLVVEHSEYNRQESNVNYLTERKEYRKVFAELDSKDAVARRIVVEVIGGSRTPIAGFSLKNNGLLSLRYGNMNVFVEGVVSDVAAIGNLKNRLFANRERREMELHPLEFSFDSGILSDRAANAVLIDSLGSVPKSGLAVFHANPYLHVLYTDFRDGSSFNIYSSSDSALTIVPSTRASVSALMRVYRAVSERFADCDIAEPSAQSPTLSDFFDD